MKTIEIVPIAKEKALGELTRNKYMFYTPLDASKDLIAKNVAKQFGVTVTGVTTLIRKGKAVKFSKGKHRYPGTTYRQDVKIAYVTLKEGDKIKVFDEEPVEETKPEEKTKVTSVKADDKPKKTSLFAKRRTGSRGDK